MDDGRNQMLRMLEELKTECTDEVVNCEDCALAPYCRAEETVELDNKQLMLIIEKLMY